MSDLTSLVTGLSQSINGYLQKGQQQKRDLQTYQAQTDIQTKQKEDLDQYAQSQTPTVTPDMAEQMIPGSSKWVNGFQQQNGRYPSIDEVNSGLKQIIEQLKASNKGAGSAEKNQQAMLQKAQGAYNSDSTLKQEKNALDAASTAEDQVHLAISNPVAYSSVPITLARMMTGTSRINQQEIQRLGGSQAILDRANQLATQMGRGTVTADNAAWMEDLVRTLQKSHQKNIEDIGVQHASQYRRLSKQDLISSYKDVTGQDIPERFTQSPTQHATGASTDLEAKKQALRLKLGL